MCICCVMRVESGREQTNHCGYLPGRWWWVPWEGRGRQNGRGLKGATDAPGRLGAWYPSKTKANKNGIADKDEEFHIFRAETTAARQHKKTKQKKQNENC